MNELKQLFFSGWQHITTVLTDKSCLDLLTILIAGAGIFAALFEYSVPQLTKTFWNENPYLVKQNIIKTTLDSCFILIAVGGLLVQSYSIICASRVHEGARSELFYLLFFAIGIVAMFLVINLVADFGHWIARKRWEPIIAEKQSDIYKNAKFIIENGGWNENQIKDRDSGKIDNPEDYINRNFNTADKYLTQMEDLFELPQSKEKDRKVRLNLLKKYFE